jgi:hypothetical protein
VLELHICHAESPEMLINLKWEMVILKLEVELQYRKGESRNTGAEV